MSAKKEEINNLKRLLDLSEAPVSNICQAFFDSFVERNVENLVKTGIKAVIIRRQIGKCCDWCRDKAGVYEYGKEPQDIYRRHDNCRCLVTYRGEKGRYQDVWSKKEYRTQKQARQAREKEIEVYSSGLDEVSKEYLKKANPFSGTIDYQDGYKEGPDHTHKVNNANWIHENFGGDILFLAEDDVNKMPDFLWNSHYWELKNPTTEKAANSAVRHALHQLLEKGDEGGIILDYSDYNFNLEKLIETINSRMRNSKPKTAKIDVIIRSKKGIERMLRY